MLFLFLDGEVFLRRKFSCLYENAVLRGGEDGYEDFRVPKTDPGKEGAWNAHARAAKQNQKDSLLGEGAGILLKNPCHSRTLPEVSAESLLSTSGLGLSLVLRSASQP